MNFKTVLFLSISFFIFSCSDEDVTPIDPCIQDANSLACPTGDFDGDGIINSEDSAPSDACVPNKPAFEENVIGTWTYNIVAPGKVKINADGTYEDIENEILSNGDINSKTWRIEGEKLIFDVENASISLTWKEYDCSKLIFVGFLTDCMTFNRD